MKTTTYTEFCKKYDVNFKAQKGDEGFIGYGGYGVVLKGYDKTVHTHVAIKRSDTDKGLLDEVEKGEKVPKHKNIARYLEGYRVESDSGNFDIAILQYYPKGNLNQLIDTEKLSWKQLDDILVGILEGLKFLHKGFKDANGKHTRIIHRDLKPANILIAEYNGTYTPLLTDFGISKLVYETADQQENSIGVGTPSYKAPEQVKNGKIKSNLDLWAFGVMLFKILQGYHPFSGTDVELLEQITKADLEDIYQQVNNHPEKYQQIIKKCLIRDIDRRVQTAQELIEIIQGTTDVNSYHPAEDKTDTIEKEEESNQRKTRNWLKTASVGLAAAVSFFGIYWFSIGKDVPPTPDNKQMADSLFTIGQGQLDSLDKNIAYRTLKQAVDYNPELKSQVYELFEIKIESLKSVPEVAEKYKVLSKEFK